MNSEIKSEDDPSLLSPQLSPASAESSSVAKGKNKNRERNGSTTVKRRCVSTACIACRRRKSKCDGNLPKCAACASVYMTECEYAPHTDHRRKGVYKKDIDNLKTRNSTLQTLIQAILNYEEEDVLDLVRQIRSCESLDDLAETVVAKERGLLEEHDTPDSPIYGSSALSEVPRFEAELSGKMGDLLLEGSVKFIGGTSNLIWLPPDIEFQDPALHSTSGSKVVWPKEEGILSWTTVTQDKELILHLINMYFCWHYAFFTTLSKTLFYRDFLQGVPTEHCSSLLVNIMLCLGCHFTTWPEARADPEDSATTGDHFFKEVKRLMYENDEFSNVKLCTVQALALMSVREAGCGREGNGWVYSGISFRMACDLGLQVDAPAMAENSSLKDEDVDARRITFWGCFLFDKCWSNYLGRVPMLQMPNITVRKPEVFPTEDSEMWSPYTDSGMIQANVQPARTRAIALQISKLAEISSDLLISFYHHSQLEKPMTKQAELKKLTDLHTRLEAWRKDLPMEMEAKEGQLPQVLLMHMFFQLLFIHLYRPFLKYTKNTSPLPPHVSPRKFCTHAAGAISKLLRLYKRTHGLRQICNVAVYITHSACTIHILNLPDKNAKRDIIHGVKHLEEIGECWTCARRTLRMLNIAAEKWNVELPEEVAATFSRSRSKWSTPEPVTPEHIFSFPIPAPTLQNPTSISAQRTLPDRGSGIPNTAPVRSNIQTLPTGLFTSVVSSPASPESDARRSSGDISLPPQSATEFMLNAGRNRPPTYLTKAQRDAWDAHQAARRNMTAVAASGSSTVPNSASAAVLFGGVDSLVEESQDWWLKDQSALAMGFDNWADIGGGNGEWSGFNSMSPPSNGDNGYSHHYQNPSNGGSAPYPFTSAGPGSGSSNFPNHYPTTSSSASYNPTGVLMASPGKQNGGNGMSAKRQYNANTFDEDMYF